MLRKFKVNVNGKSYLVELEELGASPSQQPLSQPVAQPVVAQKAETSVPASQPEEALAQVPTGEGITIEAPMPGNVLAIKVKVGDQVAYEQPVVVLEAMKMENELVAPKAGTVTAIYVTEGSAIDVGKPIITIG